MPNQQSGSRDNNKDKDRRSQQAGDTSKRGFASMDDEKQRDIAKAARHQGATSRMTLSARPRPARRAASRN